jgi:hypothetical protein
MTGWMHHYLRWMHIKESLRNEKSPYLCILRKRFSKVPKWRTSDLDIRAEIDKQQILIVFGSSIVVLLLLLCTITSLQYSPGFS